MTFRLLSKNLQYFITSLVFALITHVTVAQTQTAQVELGIDVLEQNKFQLLQGKRVGLLTHPAGVNRHGVSTIEVLRKSKYVNLVALFGPEHGIYGNEAANTPVENRTDKRTGLPVYSLYGQYRKPTPEMLKGLDVMVVDLQDLGVRSYTYISCLLYVMEACFEQNVEVVVLDRPNPLGGLKVDGPMMEREWMSYVGAYNIPYVYGLTIGELARWAKSTPGSTMLRKGLDRKGKLQVVTMRNWKRSMLWTDTGLPWVPTSPNIPDFAAAIGYSITGLGSQIGGFQHGIGTDYPFRLLSYPGKSSDDILNALLDRQIDGLGFKIIEYKDRRGKMNTGVYVLIDDWQKLKPTELSFNMMQLACEWSLGNPFKEASKNDIELFKKHVGSSAWLTELKTRGERARVKYFVERWARDARKFQAQTERFWLYPKN